MTTPLIRIGAATLTAAAVGVAVFSPTIADQLHASSQHRATTHAVAHPEELTAAERARLEAAYPTTLDVGKDTRTLQGLAEHAGLQVTGTTVTDTGKTARSTPAGPLVTHEVRYTLQLAGTTTDLATFLDAVGHLPVRHEVLAARSSADTHEVTIATHTRQPATPPAGQPAGPSAHSTAKNRPSKDVP